MICLLQVLEYEEKPTLPAPFTVLTHFHRICKYIYRRCRGKNTRFESGLKLFLSKYDLERLYDFEEECVEGMLKENELESQRKTDVRVKNVQVSQCTIQGVIQQLRGPNFTKFYQILPNFTKFYQIFTRFYPHPPRVEKKYN